MEKNHFRPSNPPGTWRIQQNSINYIQWQHSKYLSSNKKYFFSSKHFKFNVNLSPFINGESACMEKKSKSKKCVNKFLANISFDLSWFHSGGRPPGVSLVQGAASKVVRPRRVGHPPSPGPAYPAQNPPQSGKIRFFGVSGVVNAFVCALVCDDV